MTTSTLHADLQFGNTVCSIWYQLRCWKARPGGIYRFTDSLSLVVEADCQLEALRVLWASPQYGGCIPRASPEGEPGTNPVAFDDLVSEVT